MDVSDENSGRQISWCIGAMAALLVLSIWFGYYSATAYPQLIRQVLEGVAKKADVIFSDPNPWLISAKIFLNNAAVSFLALASGILLGIAPVVFIWSNGYIIGLIVGVAPSAGISSQKVIIALLPHGILELPAFVIAAGYGLWLGYRFYRFLRYRDPFRKHLKRALGKYARIVAPLLLVAALIEAFITPSVIGFLK